MTATAAKRAIAPKTSRQVADGWVKIQDAMAANSGVSLLLVEGEKSLPLATSNNNSICAAMQSSPEQAKLCARYCGQAHQRATTAGKVSHYRCHAGLHCFAMPVEIGDSGQLAVIGGRAFLHSADFGTLVSRACSGDLQELWSTELFSKVIFADEASLDRAALQVAEAAANFKLRSAQLHQSRPGDAATAGNGATTAAAELSRESTRWGGELDRRRRLARTVRSFSERIDVSEPDRTYESILAESAELLRAERGLLLVFAESVKELTVKAVRGIPLSATGDMPAAQRIAQSALREGRPLMASDIGMLDPAPALPGLGYQSQSYISYPVMIGDRRIGVLNLGGKAGGGVYDETDLSVIDSVAPQIALALERAAWQEKANKFQLMSITDPLTGLHNRRYLEARLSEEVSRSKRYNHPMSFMMIDIDDFKIYNDRHGHQAGDRALEITAQCLRSVVRRVDTASRYGGEEFSILLPQTTLREARSVADRIRRKIANTPYPQGESQPLGAVTVSIGLSTNSALLDSADTIVRAADRALYHAKRQGKNRAYAYRTRDL